MFSHVMIGTNDLEKSKLFYDALLRALGGREAIVDPKGRLIYLHNGGTFLVTPPIDGEPAAMPMGARSALRPTARIRQMPGTPPGWPLGARPLKTRQAGAKATVRTSTSPICATRTVTRFAPCFAARAA